MKRVVLIAAAAAFLLSGCRIDNKIIIVSETPITSYMAAQPFEASENTLPPGTSADPKLIGDISIAPTRGRITEAEGYDLSAVLTSDSMQYTLPMDEDFAVALNEDAASGNRWLLSSEDSDFELVRETSIDGYRVFIMKPLSRSQTYLLFELASPEGESLEILTFIINLG